MAQDAHQEPESNVTQELRRLPHRVKANPPPARRTERTQGAGGHAGRCRMNGTCGQGPIWVPPRAGLRLPGTGVCGRTRHIPHVVHVVTSPGSTLPGASWPPAQVFGRSPKEQQPQQLRWDPVGEPHRRRSWRLRVFIRRRIAADPQRVRGGRCGCGDNSVCACPARWRGFWRRGGVCGAGCTRCRTALSSAHQSGASVQPRGNAACRAVGGVSGSDSAGHHVTGCRCRAAARCWRHSARVARCAPVSVLNWRPLRATRWDSLARVGCRPITVHHTT